MSWHYDGTLSSIDAESTGVDIETARIVTWSRWIIKPAKGTKRLYDVLVNPGIEIPEQATAIHGISTEHARVQGIPAYQAIPAIAKDALMWSRDEGAVTVAFNAAYDVSLLHRECLRYGHADLAKQIAALCPVVDPHVADKHCDVYRRGKRTLTAAAAHYGVPLDEADAHGSSADALAAARVAYKIAAKYSGIRDTPPKVLHRQQIQWRAEQQRSLEAYLRKKDPAAVCPPEWPLVPVPVPTQEEIDVPA